MLYQAYRVTDGVAHKIGRPLKRLNVAAAVATIRGQVCIAHTNTVVFYRGTYIPELSATPVPFTPRVTRVQVHPRVPA